jgi:hypothetical protein
MVVVKISQGESPEVWEPGMYPAKVTACEQTESTWPGKEGQPRFKWVLRVSNDDGEYTDIWHWTGASLSTHPNATLRPFLKAVAPDLELDDPNDPPDTDEVIGRKCQVILGINEAKGRNSVEKVLPASSRKTRTAATEEEGETRQSVAAGPRAAVPTVAQRKAAAATEINEDDIPF